MGINFRFPLISTHNHYLFVKDPDHRSSFLKLQSPSQTDILSDSLSMVTSKVTRFTVKRKIATEVVEFPKASPFPPSPLVEDNSVLVASQSDLTQQDSSPPRVGQDAFQALPFFKSTQ